MSMFPTAPHIPAFITPKSLDDYDDDAAQAYIDAVRERRLHALRIYEQSLREAQQAREASERESLLKQTEMLRANVNRVDKALDALEKRINRIRALRLSLGMEV